VFALVTADAADGLDPDLEPLAEAMTELLDHDGEPPSVHIVSWDDAELDWSVFDAVIIRSTWDYTDRLAEFVDWVDRVAAVTRLVNPADAVRWSSDKRYLADLAADDISIVPTIFVAPGEPTPHMPCGADGRPVEVAVVKPTVGAGSSGARRCTNPAVLADHVASLHAAGRTAMIQPYLGGVDEHGETALCFVPGRDGHLEFSHAFVKGAILQSTKVELVGDLFAKEDIGPRTASAAELDLAERVLASAPVAALSGVDFARVDIAPHGPGGRDDSGSLVVVELELIEPSFYHESSPGSAERLAAAFVQRLSSPSGRRTWTLS